MIIRELRDAEVQIKLLEGRIAQLEKLVALGTSNTTTKEIVRVETNTISDMDSELTVDESTVLHRKLHIFNRFVDIRNILKIQELLIYLSDGTKGWDLQIQGAPGDLWLVDQDVNIYFKIVNLGAGAGPGDILFLVNILPANDNQIDLGTTTERFKDAYAHNLHLTNDLPITEGGTGASTAANARTNLDVYSKAEVATQISAALASYYTSAQVDTLLLAKAAKGTYSVSVTSTSITVPSTPNTQSHGHTSSVTI